jgi:hypothetical protein
MNLETLIVPLKLDKSGFQDALKGVTVAVAAGVGAVAAGMAVAVKATMDWANDLDQLGDVMDGTNKDFAAIAFVARKSGVGVDALTKANIILEKGLLKVDGTLDTTGKQLKEYGIDVKDANGEVKNSVQLTDEIAAKYAKLGTQQERINFLTEIYGKSGAQMVDFFDTLNSEGGISAVTKKVEALGLAIDPTRYEQFNRNLEELKLIGLGLAVSFTEMIMPALEGFLGKVTEIAQSPKFKEITGKAKEMFAALLGGDTKKFGELAGELAGELDEGLAGMIDGVDWAKHGASLSKSISNMLKGAGDGVDVPKSMTSLASALNNFVGGLFGTNEAGLQTIVQTNLAKIGNTWYGQGVQWGVRLNTALQLAPILVTTFLMNLDTLIDNKLREIAKTFFNRALGWTQQARNGFTSGQGGLLGAISGLVNTINGILRKIITSFTISVIMPSFLGGTAGITGSASVGSSSDKKKKNARATGGAVVAGQAYMVGERGVETFVPNTSGRVEANQSKPVEARIDVNLLGRVLAAELAKALG